MVVGAESADVCESRRSLSISESHETQPVGHTVPYCFGRIQ